MKVKVKYTNNYYHIYLGEEHMKCTDDEIIVKRIIRALITMFGKEIEVEYFGMNECPTCKGTGKVI